jgi:glutamyl-tRNA synthetase
LEAGVATYAHLPLLLGTDGKRLSKRHGAKGITEYIEAGYLPQALVNYLSLLGWSPAGDVTIVSVDDSVRQFDLADVSTNPAVFDQSKLAPLVQERTKLLTEVGPQVSFLFADEIEIDPASWEKAMGSAEAGVVLEAASSDLDLLANWDHDSIESALRSMLDRLGVHARKGLQPLRVAVTGSTVSPPLFESMAILGKRTTLARLQEAHHRLSATSE